MNRQQRIVWTKGMFLNPQHFQTQDQYIDDTIQFRFGATSYANWGVTALRVDVEALGNGLFRLLECRGLMPDGLGFQMPEADRLPPSREIEGFFPPGEKELDVYLGIPEQHLEAANVALTLNGSAALPDTRYTAETRQMVDLNEGLERRPVQIERRNFRILFGPEYRDGFTSLRIGQLTRDAAGAPRMKPTFIAACLDIGHSEYLMGLVRRQVEILATKSRTISSSRRERGKAAADFTASETANFWLLHTANSCLPELRHIWKIRRGHPEQAYLAMLRLAGALTTFSLESAPEDLPDYDHNNLGACFTELDSRIRDLMETVIPTRHFAIPLVHAEGLMWKGTVPDDRYFRGSQFYLAVQANMDTGELIQKIPRLLKISSPDEINRLIDKALAGVALTYAPAPASIPMKLGNQYFAFTQTGPLWDKIQLSRNLAVYAPAEIKQPKMEVLVVLE